MIKIEALRFKVKPNRLLYESIDNVLFQIIADSRKIVCICQNNADGTKKRVDDVVAPRTIHDIPEHVLTCGLTLLVKYFHSYKSGNFTIHYAIIINRPGYPITHKTAVQNDQAINSTNARNIFQKQANQNFCSSKQLNRREIKMFDKSNSLLDLKKRHKLQVNSTNKFPCVALTSTAFHFYTDDIYILFPICHKLLRENPIFTTLRKKSQLTDSKMRIYIFTNRI
ncbi:hypothetical protein WN51_09324 [Melipona quadrifasciata]|uniref:Uncharacterized protein n=1 Tax=Melipona quadrifasciata TaxID=166423 RepID=A0A0M9A7W0_9HYME|nr:hypothetical protein WN51_09324 [Melipona quadrifasciata]